MKESNKISLGFVAISVIMIFAALATDIFWLARLFGKPFPQTIRVERLVYEAFAVPDVLLSLLLYTGAFGLIMQKKFGFIISWVAMGMWIFDSLLVLNISKFSNLSFIGPSLVFAVFSIAYLWKKFAIVSFQLNSDR
jgi:hypothetical protein